MKKLVLFVLLLVLSTAGFSQIKLRMATGVNGTGDTVKTNISGTTLKKGDQFIVYIASNGNGDTTTRHLYFDLQYQNNVFELVSINHTGTGGNGGVLPAGSSISESYYQYPGYRFAQNTQNTTANGNTNYDYAGYTYTQGGNQTIIRYDLLWSSTKGMPYTGYWSMVKLVFRLKSTAVGFAYDPIRMNFGAGWDYNGNPSNPINEAPKSSLVYIDPTSESYVNASVSVNSALGPFSLTRVAFIDTAAKSVYLVDANDAGKLAIDQTRFKPNTTYRVSVAVNADALKNMFNAAVTVSDFTAAQAEFTSQNLDGTASNANIKTGIGFLAADVNQNRSLDPGDLNKLFAQTVGLDTLYVLPSTYRPGIDIYMDVPTFRDSLFNNLSTSTWKSITNTAVFFKTGAMGDNLPLNIKYVIPGDVNRSMSSQVVATDGTIKSFSIGPINTPNPSVNTIDVNLSNLVVTSNSITIPVEVVSKADLSALQFEFTYDTTKIKFESLASTLPNTWFTFATPRSGRIKFGAIDKGTMPATGTFVPFTLKFSAVDNGLDLATLIRVGTIMDAADAKGNQLGINLNTTTIKLTGYNNF